MKLISVKHLVIGLCMFAAAGMAIALKPAQRIADHEHEFDLEVLIPKTFADWKIDASVAPLIANPEQEARLNAIYKQTLTRTYVNSSGERIMLSIAYGGDQSDNMAVHKPEVCYPAQGFHLLKNPEISTFRSGEGDIPVKRLVAAQGPRVEPITYWTTVGDAVEVDSLKWKLKQLKYGLTGRIPDGLLFRVSSIQNDEGRAYHVQDAFTRDLLKALSPAGRKRIIGNPSSAG